MIFCFTKFLVILHFAKKNILIDKNKTMNKTSNTCFVPAEKPYCIYYTVESRDNIYLAEQIGSVIKETVDEDGESFFKSYPVCHIIISKNFELPYLQAKVIDEEQEDDDMSLATELRYLGKKGDTVSPIMFKEMLTDLSQLGNLDNGSLREIVDLLKYVGLNLEVPKVTPSDVNNLEVYIDKDDNEKVLKCFDDNLVFSVRLNEKGEFSPNPIHEFALLMSEWDKILGRHFTYGLNTKRLDKESASKIHELTVLANLLNEHYYKYDIHMFWDACRLHEALKKDECTKAELQSVQDKVFTKIDNFDSYVEKLVAENVISVENDNIRFSELVVRYNNWEWID